MFNFTKSQTESDLNKKSQLNLKLTDFKKQTNIKLGSIVSAIDRLPAFHLNQLKEITYDPEQLTIQDPDNPFPPKRINAKGVYIQNQRMVAIFETEDKGIFFHTLFHEIGHHVYFAVLGQELKHTWVTEICRQDSFITDYASLNAAEDFAESYVSYLQTPDELKTLPLKYHFMDQHVFKTKDKTPRPEKLDLLA